MRFATFSGLLAGSLLFINATLIESEPNAAAAWHVASLAKPDAIRPDGSGASVAPSGATQDVKEPLENPDVLDGTGPVDDAKDDKAPTPLERARAALAQSNAPALSDNEVCSSLVEVARANALPVGFLTNLIWRESRFDHEAISRAGAMGIAQFMPDVADKLGLDAFDARDALPASGRLLRALVGRFNNLGLVAAAYNAGPKRVFDWLQQRATLPRETRDYVSIVTGRPVEEWRGVKKGVVFNVPRQVPCHQSAAFSAVAEAERAAQLREVAEQQRLAEKEREAARLQKKSKLAAANRAKFRPAVQNASPASLRRAASGDKRLSVRRNLRSA